MAVELFRIIPEKLPITVNGEWVGTFNKYGTILQVLVEPTNLETKYNFGIKDEGGYIIYQKYDIEGALSDSVEIYTFPGEKALVINSASNDERFKVKLIYRR